MKCLLKFVSLWVGSFLIGMAFIPMIMWGVITAVMNLSPDYPPEMKLEMKDLIMYHCIYATEIAVGLLLIKLGLSCCKPQENCCEVK